MAILHLAGLSTRTLSMVSRRLLGLEVSKDTVSGSLDLVKDEALAWLTRPITKPFWALYIDEQTLMFSVEEAPKKNRPL